MEEEKTELERSRSQLRRYYQKEDRRIWSEYDYIEKAKDNLSPLTWCLLCHQSVPTIQEHREQRRATEGTEYPPAQIRVSSTADGWQKLTRFTFERENCIGGYPYWYPAEDEGQNPYLKECIEANLASRILLLKRSSLLDHFDSARDADTSQETRVLLDYYLETLQVDSKSFDLRPTGAITAWCLKVIIELASGQS